MCEKVIARIKYDQDKTTGEVEKFNATLAEKKETLDEARGNTRQLMNDGSVTEKIRQRKDIEANMNTLIAQDLGTLLVEKYTLPPLEGWF